MQITYLNEHLKPITLAAVTLLSSNIKYTDAEPFSEFSPTSRKIAEYLQETDKNDSATFITKFKFLYHLNRWESNTMFLSSVYQIIEDEDFKAITSMGKQVVPYILEELEKKPSCLVWALNFIFERKISSSPNLTITEACKLWIKSLAR